MFFAVSSVRDLADYAQATGGQPGEQHRYADGVKIKGTFYENAKANSPP